LAVKPYIPGDEVLKLEFLINEQNNGLDSLLKEAFVSFELNKIPTARFTFIATNPDIEKKDKIPADDIKENDEITFNVVTEKEKKLFFKGFIKSAEKAHDGNTTTVKIECKDKSFQLTVPSAQTETNNQTFDDKLQLFTKKLELGPGMSGKDWGKEKITHNSNTVPWDFLLGYLDSVGISTAGRNGVFNGVDILAAPPEEKYLADNAINLFQFSGKAD